MDGQGGAATLIHATAANASLAFPVPVGSS